MQDNVPNGTSLPIRQHEIGVSAGMLLFGIGMALVTTLLPLLVVFVVARFALVVVDDGVGLHGDARDSTKK